MYEHQTSYVLYCRLSEDIPALMCVPSLEMTKILSVDNFAGNHEMKLRMRKIVR